MSSGEADRGAAIYMVGGPSGAGKDTLLLNAQEALQAQGVDKVVFVQRHLTRAAEKCTALEVSRTPEEIDAERAAGEHAFYWEAHSTQYAIPKKPLEEALAAGKRCVLNVSRTIVKECIEKYGSDSVEVYFLNITASTEVLTTRLTRRGREDAEEVRKRVARAKEDEPSGPHVIHIVNEASRDEGAAMVVGALMGSTKFSLWLVPSSSAPLTARVSEAIGQLADSFGARTFAPHVTLCPSFVATQRDAVALTETIGKLLGGPVTEEFDGQVSIDPATWSRALVLELKADGPLATASAAAREQALPAGHPDHSKAYAPHLSLLYGEHGQEQLDAARATIQAQLEDFGPAFVGAALVCVMTTGKAHWCWQEVARVEL